MSNKLYRGIRQGHVAKVFVDNEELSLAEANKLHPSMATVEFSYFGDGPSQTALAILYDATGDKENSVKYMHDFKFEFIANVPYEVGFSIMESQVKEWMQKRLDINKGGWAI